MSHPRAREVRSMTCGHCGRTTKRALGDLGHAQVEVQVKAKEVRRAAESAGLRKILAVLEAEGDPASVR